MENQNSKRYILIDVVPLTIKREDAKENLDEMISLISTLGGAQIVEIIQRRANPHPGTYIGSGKAQEVALLIEKHKVDVVVINGITTSTQSYKLLSKYWKINPNIEVWDRVDLILQIFAKHAKTKEAKLQIELAKMKHMGPRMYGLSEELGRQGGGIGTRGAGETNVEIMKRHWRDEIKSTQKKLEEIEKTKQRQLERRKQIGFKTASIVGYTNAGKTTLFNLLVKKQKLAKDVLFATLESTTGKVYLPDAKEEILLSDTIGFIQNLPPDLIQAFKSTLFESINAYMLLHVIDASDPKMYEKIKVVNDILQELGINDKKQIIVFNKSDRITNEEKNKIAANFKNHSYIFISAKNQLGLEELKKKISSLM